METEVLEKMNERIVKSFVDLAILAKLGSGPMSGYDMHACWGNPAGRMVENRRPFEPDPGNAGGGKRCVALQV